MFHVDSAERTVGPCVSHGMPSPPPRKAAHAPQACGPGAHAFGPARHCPNPGSAPARLRVRARKAVATCRPRNVASPCASANGSEMRTGGVLAEGGCPCGQSSAADRHAALCRSTQVPERASTLRARRCSVRAWRCATPATRPQDDLRETRGEGRQTRLWCVIAGRAPRERGQMPAGGAALVRAGRSCVAAVAECKRDVNQTRVGSPSLRSHACGAQSGISNALTDQRGGKGLLDGDEACTDATLERAAWGVKEVTRARSRRKRGLRLCKRGIDGRADEVTCAPTQTGVGSATNSKGENPSAGGGHTKSSGAKAFLRSWRSCGDVRQAFRGAKHTKRG
ncbi:hypothetical protein ERJ75_001120400 [Trypanosoma vivax]|nr:hypothetical protein ERJ75_001120400 [Trypanosoma vivax]